MTVNTAQETFTNTLKMSDKIEMKIPNHDHRAKSPLASLLTTAYWAIRLIYTGLSLAY